jgi:hypothetical protein
VAACRLFSAGIFSAYFSALKIEATFSSETSVHFQRITRRYIPEDSALHHCRCLQGLSFLALSVLRHQDVST